ncbi:MAG: glycosyltransferase family 2 protein [Chitinophagaceae bacterium]|nr:glycosyltransferase family 2 protein [Chitinophagaceae bacterium]MBP7109643.1 glycosyltransferase family 2 protein [Chitinophagaceae bacterium]
MKIGLIVTTFNRPEYLQKCLESIKNADTSQLETILIVDDCSDNPQTRSLIDDFDVEGVELIKAYSKENRTIKGSLLFGLDLLFLQSDVVINLDGDAIVSKRAFNVLINYHSKYPDHLLTGFNCTTKNKNGSVRHKIISEGPGYNTKHSVGGINMVFSKRRYLEWIRPALVHTIKFSGNWDHRSCLNSADDKHPIICVVPSVVDHIGISSSMGHSAGGEPPDVASDFIYETPKDYGTRLYVSQRNDGLGLAYDKAKLHIPFVTLISVDDNIDAIIKAADISCRHIEFGAVKLLSSKDSDDKRAVKIRHLGSKKEYSQFVLKELAAYIETPYALLIQHDGYVLNFQAWRDTFLEYDMVGAVWDFRQEKRTANGGFSIRSRRMMDAIAADDNIYLQNDHIITNYAEDHVLFYIYREYLEKTHNIKIAPEDVCNQFSMEAWGREDKRYKGSFGFHGYGIDFSKSNLDHTPY